MSKPTDALPIADPRPDLTPTSMVRPRVRQIHIVHVHGQGFMWGCEDCGNNGQASDSHELGDSIAIHLDTCSC